MIGTSVAEEASDEPAGRRRGLARQPGRPQYAITGLSEVGPCRPGAWRRGEPLPVTPAIDRSASAQPELSRIDDLSNALNVVQSEVETGLCDRVHDRPGLADRIADHVALQRAPVTQHDLDPLDPFRALHEGRRSGLLLANHEIPPTCRGRGSHPLPDLVCRYQTPFECDRLGG